MTAPPTKMTLKKALALRERARQHYRFSASAEYLAATAAISSHTPRGYVLMDWSDLQKGQRVRFTSQGVDYVIVSESPIAYKRVQAGRPATWVDHPLLSAQHPFAFVKVN